MKKAIKKSLNIYVAGFGCCKQEIYASSAPVYDVEKLGVKFVNLPELADLLIIQGFINEVYAKRLIEFYNMMREPKIVALFGTCTIDSYGFGGREGIEMIKKEIPIEIYVPGCPPRPEAFIYSLLRVIDKDEY